MGIPSYQDMLLPMLTLISGGMETLSECLPKLAKDFNLSNEEVQICIPSGKQTLLSNRAQWARQYLSQAGLVETKKRGTYVITPLGAQLLGSNPAALSKDSLKKYPKFLEFLSRSTKKMGVPNEVSIENSTSIADATPEDKIASAHAELEAALVADLLAAVQAVTPSRFEQLIVDLLLAMGYGGGDRSMGERIGKTGDGGIDGIINEDALGLDAVYIQAKRYAPENKIGRPALQAFVGSLTGEGANKGVFVTTSDFSKEARDYLNKVQHRIVLINGDRLARLMIQHEVGVRARKTYVLRSVDEDYFSEF